MSKPILCIDFDGVLHSYSSGWKGADVIPDPPVHGAVAFLMEAVRHFEVHIFSSRSHQTGGIPAMRAAIHKWILEEGYPAGVALGMAYEQTRSTVNDTPSALVFPTEKPSAMVSLDDRAIQFEGTWPSFDALLNFQPWYKRK